MKRILTIIAASLLCTLFLNAKTHNLASPDGNIFLSVNIGEKISYSVAFKGKVILADSPLSVSLDNGSVWGVEPSLKKVTSDSVSGEVESPFYRSAKVAENYKSMTFVFKGNYNVEFRVYNDGVAYRFANTGKGAFNILNEQVEYIFPEDYDVTIPYVRDYHADFSGDFEAQFHNSFENEYVTVPCSKADPGKLAFLPLTVTANDGVRMTITEVNLENYPGLYLTSGNAAANGLKGVFAPRPEDYEQGGHNMLEMLVTGREDYIAKVEGPRTFPWRAMIITDNDAALAGSDLGWLLAEQSRISDISWIRPGKVAWEWWYDWNLDGVDFKTGVNDDTYKAYIDFAAVCGLEYVILDEGWAVNLQADLMQVVPEIHLKELVDYAAARNVGIILWAGYWAFDRDMEEVCRHYSEMGVKGFKVDFMNRDDQVMTEFNYRAAEMAAKYHLVLDLHGTHKPAGLNRTYPNVLNFEGVNGMEQMKWSTKELDQVEYETTFAFIRQASGPQDYTQGALSNATYDSFYPNNSEPMSQGTRCHQLALYIVLDSPLTMLCDSPSNYRRETDAMDFITDVPVCWDETRVIAGEMGEYIVTARRKADKWYIGGITDWNARDLSLDLSFLGNGSRKAVLMRDGVNAHRRGRDYKKESVSVDTAAPFNIHLAPGGGFTLVVE